MSKGFPQKPITGNLNPQGKWLTTDVPEIMFEDTSTGRMKKRIWDMSIEEVEKLLKEEYGIPGSPSGLGIAGTYIQNTPRSKVCELREKNDIVIVPIGCTENHGLHANSGLDTFMVTQLCEAVKRKSIKDGCEVALAFPALLYGGHPYHHVGMPGTINIPQKTVEEMLIYILLGLWDDGFRKIILVNNHGHHWMLEAAIQEFFKRFQLPGFVTLVDWHRAVREFFYARPEKDDFVSSQFVHADESETSVGMLLFPEMLDLSTAVDTEPKSFMLQGHYDTACDAYRRPHSWAEVQGNAAMEIFGTPEGVVGYPKRATAEKAMRPIAAICEYLTLMCKEIREAYPVGTVPEMMTMRTAEELAPCLKTPLSEGWMSVHGLKKIGVFND